MSRTASHEARRTLTHEWKRENLDSNGAIRSSNQLTTASAGKQTKRLGAHVLEVVLHEGRHEDDGAHRDGALRLSGGCDG
jgi:hypothetical protein